MFVVPHASWRGRFDLGTYPAGSASGMDVRWPSQDDRVFHNGGGASGRGDWFGGLLNEQKDASGLMYRRNRYYDPQTGTHMPEREYSMVQEGTDRYDARTEGDGRLEIRISVPARFADQWLAKLAELTTTDAEIASCEGDQP